MGKPNALESRDIINSKLAKVLLDDNKFPDRSLKIKVHKIDSDLRRQQALLDNEQRIFKKQGLLYNFEPTMVVERPASPQKFVEQCEDTEMNTPHYMTGLERNKAQVYIAMPTVDAFKVQKKRKRNLWENKYTEKDINEKFRSIVLKSPPLTDDEHFDLDKGWTVYRPISRMEEAIRQTLKERKAERQRLARSVKVVKPAEDSSVFLTEVQPHSARKGRRNTRFSSTLSANHIPKARTPSSSVLLRARKEPVESVLFDKEKLEDFDKMRDRQRSHYHRYSMR